MIRLKATQGALIRRLSEAAYPKECCGLLIGRRLEDGEVAVDEVRPCRNLLSQEQDDRFEIDPADRFAAMREAAAMGRMIVGHYHSHPRGGALPSETDRKMMYEPELIWLIAGMENGRAGLLQAFRPNLDAEGFDSVPLVLGAVTDQNSPP